MSNVEISCFSGKKDGQKKLIILDIIIATLAIGLIPIDLCLVSVPKWISLISMIALLIFVVLEWRKGKCLWGKFLFSVVNVFILLFVFVGTYCNPYRNSISMRVNPNYDCEEFGTLLSYKEAKSDLDQAMRYLKNVHPMFLHGLTDEVNKRYDLALAHLQEDDSISVNDLSREIEKIVSELGDGHTYVAAYYPEYHYLKYIYGHSMAGDELVAVNGLSLEEILEAKSDYFSFESKEYGLRKVESYLQSLEDLDYLGFDADGITYTYTDSMGYLFEESYGKEDFLMEEEYWQYNDPDRLKGQESDENSSDDGYEFVGYEIMEPENLAVLTLYSCDYNEIYRECLAQMFREVKDKGIGNVCVDLRANGGGNSMVADEFIHYLDVDSYKSWGQDWRMGPFLIPSEGKTFTNYRYTDLVFGGNVYVLTSTDTFSSAMDFAMLISDNKLGTIVGEASGNKPGGYGEIASFKLKNSGLFMQISTKKWYRVDETIEDEFVEPDIQCDSDKALEVLLEYLH